RCQLPTRGGPVTFRAHSSTLRGFDRFDRFRRWGELEEAEEGCEPPSAIGRFDGGEPERNRPQTVDTEEGGGPTWPAERTQRGASAPDSRSHLSSSRRPSRWGLRRRWRTPGTETGIPTRRARTIRSGRRLRTQRTEIPGRSVRR